jgi:hypothetical protein
MPPGKVASRPARRRGSTVGEDGGVRVRAEGRPTGSDPAADAGIAIPRERPGISGSAYLIGRTLSASEPRERRSERFTPRSRVPPRTAVDNAGGRRWLASPSTKIFSRRYRADPARERSDGPSSTTVPPGQERPPNARRRRPAPRPTSAGPRPPGASSRWPTSWSRLGR